MGCGPPHIAEKGDSAGQRLRSRAATRLLTLAGPPGVGKTRAVPSALVQSEGAQLFEERARAVQPGFGLTELEVRARAQVAALS
jgi:predicted ATPase